MPCGRAAPVWTSVVIKPPRGDCQKRSETHELAGRFLRASCDVTPASVASRSTRGGHAMPRTPTRRCGSPSQQPTGSAFPRSRSDGGSPPEAVRVGRKVLRLDPEDVDRLAVRVPTSGGVDDAALMVESRPGTDLIYDAGPGRRHPRAGHHPLLAGCGGPRAGVTNEKRVDAGASNRQRQRETQRGRHQRHQRYTHRRTCTKTVTTPVRLASSVATPVRTIPAHSRRSHNVCDVGDMSAGTPFEDPP